VITDEPPVPESVPQAELLELADVELVLGVPPTPLELADVELVLGVPPPPLELADVELNPGVPPVPFEVELALAVLLGAPAPPAVPVCHVRGRHAAITKRPAAHTSSTLRGHRPDCMRMTVAGKARSVQALRRSPSTERARSIDRRLRQPHRDALDDGSRRRSRRWKGARRRGHRERMHRGERGRGSAIQVSGFRGSAARESSPRSLRRLRSSRLSAQD
jgi:hypothetical protein